MEIKGVLSDYLRERFYRNNHPKYRKYFDEWIKNVTETQIMYFEKERLSIINQEKVQH